MGPGASDTEWTIDRRLPDIPAEPLPVDGRRAGRAGPEPRPLAGQAAHRRRGPAGGIRPSDGAGPGMAVGPGAEREGKKAWKVGPVVRGSHPLFDQGQARIGRAVAELRRAQQEYYALGVRIRATARAVQDRIARGARPGALLPGHPAAVAGADRQRGAAALQRDADRDLSTPAGPRAADRNRRRLRRSASRILVGADGPGADLERSVADVERIPHDHDRRERGEA